MLLTSHALAETANEDECASTAEERVLSALFFVLLSTFTTPRQAPLLDRTCEGTASSAAADEALGRGGKETKN